MTSSYQWSLDRLYPSFDSAALQTDYNRLLDLANNLHRFSNESYYEAHNAKEIICAFLRSENEFGTLYSKLSAYGNLTLSTTAIHADAQTLVDRVRQIGSKLAKPRVTFAYWLKTQEAYIESSADDCDEISEHLFKLNDILSESQHLLSRSEEALLSALEQTGSSAWESLQNKATSLALIEIELDGKIQTPPLSAVRNLAYHADANVRKRAFEAELAAYPKFSDISSSALNAIKGEVLTISEKRGYESPLAMTLDQSKMDKAILDALLLAIEESLPMFRTYLKAKAKKLGHENSLPFYDLFAPLGKSDQRYSTSQCQALIQKTFYDFSKELGDFATRAFDESWVDFEPRLGKRGGAFCSNIYGISESRFLCNFQGSMNNVITVAHELGHGFHGQQIFKESFLNASYPMPLAETASTFCETLIKQSLMNTAKDDEKLSLLDTAIQGYNQIIVDIYSRYLFETRLFESRKDSSLSTETLCQYMMDAQKQAYGDGLDESTYHPYMWMNKTHYYYAHRNFYNFPYAFGLLFALGLYAKYEEEGDAFTKHYNDMLRLTGKASIKDVGAFMTIDLTDVAFWRASLAKMREDIDAFIQIVGK